MSWIQRLYETYENCVAAPQFAKDPPMPVGHTKQQAHIEIVLDGEGNFLRSSVVPKEETLVPATEESAGRTSAPAPYPLCDKIQYCAGDYAELGGQRHASFDEYSDQLKRWVDAVPNAKIAAVSRYIRKRTVVHDLVRVGALHLGSDGKLLTAWVLPTAAPEIFRVLSADPATKAKDQGGAFVRWRVQVPGSAISAVWEDPDVTSAWIEYLGKQDKTGDSMGVCFVTGETTSLASNHPRGIRFSGDGGKLFSSNDKAGFTFKGRFSNAAQACGIGRIASQQAHNALSWLIRRQGGKSGVQVFLAWTVTGAIVPSPVVNSVDLFALVLSEAPDPVQIEYSGDAGQHFALRLNAAMSGYRSNLGAADNIAIIGLNSATKGRIAVSYYRELCGQEFLDRIEDWHRSTSWPQDFGPGQVFVAAPAPHAIAEVVNGSKAADSLKAATVERLLPCIIDGRPLPRDVVAMAVAAAIRMRCNRSDAKDLEWRQALGVACALYRGLEKRESYQMSLEVERNSRDYLFGRLLAIAEDLEENAVYVSGEKPRESSAAKLMQRFSMHPCSTWRTIELALKPYENRLRSKWTPVLVDRQKLLDEVMGMFRPEEFVDDSALSGEFLLGYHCQRGALWRRRGKKNVAGLGEGTSPKNGAEE
jgi:CRISPR-associated protein Csd1